MFKDLKDTTGSFDKKDIESGKAMSILSYIGILALIPYFAEKNNQYVRYHAVQGLNLFLLNIIYSVAYSILTMILAFIPVVGWILVMLLGLLSYGFLALSIIGIVYACQDKAKEIPVVNQIKIIKK